MASRGSIVSSVKAARGNAAVNPSGQLMGASPYIGGYSPLVGQLDTGQPQGGWSSTYGGTLPRLPEDFTNGAFGPFSPILPVPVDAPEDGSDFAGPRRYEYQVSWNLPVGTPGVEPIKMADFLTLKTLADLYSVARAAIELRKKEIIGLEWDVMPTREATKAMRGDHASMRDFAARRAEAVRFFRRPDPDYFTWNSWLDVVLEEILVFDALSIVFRREWDKKRRGGLLGTNLLSMEVINGPTIRPLRDLEGATPRPPAPAYQQYLYGIPRTDLWTVIQDRDLESGGLTETDIKQRYKVDQLLYMPFNPRRWTPYGFPPIEQALLPVMTALQRQKFQNDYYREGTVPAVYISPGGANTNMTPNQIRELQDALNAIAGDSAFKHKIIVLPADSRVDPQRPHPIADQFDEIIMNQVCMMFDVQPTELGIVPKVSAAASPGAARTLSKSSQTVHDRKSTKAFLKKLSDIMNYVLQDVCKQDDMRFVFEGMETTEDEETKTKTLVTQVSAGLRSIDEGREELNLQPWGLHETSEPGWATPGAGFIPLTEASQARATGYAEGPVFTPGPTTDTEDMAPNFGASDGDTPTSKPSPATIAAKPQGQSSPKPPAVPKPVAPRAKPPAAPTGGTVANGSKTPPKATDATRKKPGQGQSLDSGGSGVSAVGRKPSTKTAKILDSVHSHSRIQELEAMVRMVTKKGRSLADWEPKHVDTDTMVEIGYFQSAGIPLADAVTLIKRRRVVEINGQERWVEGDREPENVSGGRIPAGGGGPYQHPHDVNDIWMNKDDASSPIARTLTAPSPVGDHTFGGRRGVPPTFGGSVNTARDGQWPSGGIGTGQSPVTGIPGPKTVKADAAGAVYDQMLKNFPPKALEWMKDASWTGPIDVPMDKIDFDDEKSWAAAHDTDRVRHFEDRISNGDEPHPAVAVRVPGSEKVKLVDGHHRTLAYQRLGKPTAPLFVGAVPAGDKRWEETHAFQMSGGVSEANKTVASLSGPSMTKASVNYRPSDDWHIRCGTCSMFTEPNGCTLVIGDIMPNDVCDEWEPAAEPSVIAAGLAVKAQDTGRVLMLQRSLEDADPSAGMWEFPGGRSEDAESPAETAVREWQEETGCVLPKGSMIGSWISSDGVFRGFVFTVPSEKDIPIFNMRDAVINPDDPDDDHVEALAWWAPDQMAGNPAVRSEIIADLDRILDALGVDSVMKSAALRAARERNA